MKTFLAAIAATLAIAAPALGARSHQVQAIAPGGTITSVAQESARTGWPHLVTQQEREDIADLAIYRKVPMWATSGKSFCVFPFATPSPARCTVWGFARGRRTYKRSFDVQVWEDGSYRFTR